MCHFGSNCTPNVRLCDQLLKETPLDVLGQRLIPIVFCLLVVSSLASLGLNWAANYRNFYRLTRRLCCCCPVIHWNLLFDLAEDKSDEAVVLVSEIR